MPRLFSWFGGKRDDSPGPRRVLEQQVAQDSPLAGVAGTLEDFYWGRFTGGVEEDYLWRRLSDNWYQKDVIPSTYLELHNQCYEAYNSNPLAALIIDTTSNFVLGDGAVVHANNKRVQRLLDAFWQDPDNRMDQRQHWLCSELALYGELFVRFFVNEYSGEVKIAQIDPSTVDQIQSDADNIEKVLRIHRRPVGPSSSVPGQPAVVPMYGPAAAQQGTGWGASASNVGSAAGVPPLASIGGTPGPTEPANLDIAGAWFVVPDEVVQFTVNKVSNAKRGRSDLAVLLPWLRRYKDWLTDRVRINKYKGAFLYDVTLTGASKQVIDAKMLQYAAPPEPGSVVFHNESEKWDAVQPKIDADNVAADGRAIKMMIAAGAGLPEHYMSEGGNVNRATAAEMGLPTLKRFRRRQQYVRFLLRTILDRVIAEAVQAGRISPGADATYDVVLPNLDERDGNDVATAFATMVRGVAQAKAEGWITDESAVQLLYRTSGVSIDGAAEWARLKGQRPDTIGDR